jgi:flagellar protein FlgJ
MSGFDVQQQRMAKLKDGAQQFEAMLVQQILKTSKFGAAPGASDEDDSGGILQSYGTEALAKSIASSGGFGLARQIVRQVTAEDHARGTGADGSKV